ncbi:MAG TPA: hypothetical protein VL422_04325 [Miltoncostaea sp.]|nr:hypothetical protein [Miltoncostaea sp.]
MRTPQQIAPRTLEPHAPDVAVDAAGRAVAVWTGRSGRGYAVFARVRTSRTGRWAAIARLSGVAPARPLGPTVAVGRHGGALAIWRMPGGAVQSGSLGAGRTGGWVRRTVTTDGVGFDSPAAAAFPDVAAWADRASTDGVWRARRALLVDGRWRVAPALDLTAAGVVPAGREATPPDVAVGAGGDAALVWPGPAGPPAPAPSARVSVVRWPRGAQTWEAPVVLSEAGDQGDVAVGPMGHVGVTWVETGSVKVAIREPGDPAWPAPETLVAGQAVTPAFPHLAINAEGYAVDAWGETVGDLSLRARVRSGASGLWAPERTVYDGFSFFSVLELANLRAAIDAQRVPTLAWTDPEGPGSASALAARATGGTWGIAAAIPILEDIDEPALAADARGGALLVTPRARLVDDPHIDLVAAAFPAPTRVRLTAGQLRVNLRIAQAALRRSDAALARLAAVRGEDVRDGTLPASVFGPGVRIDGTPTGAAVPFGAIPPLQVAPPGPVGTVRLTVARLRAAQRIAREALSKATFGRDVLRLGLTGAQVVDGTIGAGELLPGLTVGAAVPSTEPPPPTPVFDPGASGSGRIRLTAGQLLTNQRIAQQAVLRTDWLVDRIEGGLRGADFRPGGLRADDLRGGG